jgi:FkbM family methyltransferase
MKKKFLLDKLKTVEDIANFSKINRLLNNPYRYLMAMYYREIIYPSTKKERLANVKLFYGKTMRIALPASTDIYLTGGKSHSSEIRLARFLIGNLNDAGQFLDIGAHFGYFTLIASEIVGVNGKVKSFEPTTKSYDLLRINTSDLRNTQIFQKAISNSLESITFYEFPNLHSEYNSSDISQFENEEWFNNSKPTKVEVETTTIDVLTEDGKFNPQIIKIDVEGAEYSVISGGLNFFKTNSPQIVMEYLEPKRKNETHKKALELLLSLGYHSFIIKNDGSIEPISNIDDYLEIEKLESENIVFKRETR